MEWTDDMTVRLARGTSTYELVSYLRRAAAESLPRREVLAVLTEHFGLSFDDARLAGDRVAGGVTRALSGDPANVPDAATDPIAWASYRLELGLPVEGGEAGTSDEARAVAAELLDSARRGDPTSGSEDVEVALEVARAAVAPSEDDGVRLRLLLQAAASLSVAAEACIAGLDDLPCAPEGSQEWVDGVALAEAAREVTGAFAALPDPDLELRALGLVGRIVTRLLGQSPAFVGRAMLDFARRLQRGGDPAAAADHLDALVADLEPFVDGIEGDEVADEDAIALEHLLAAIDLITDVRGPSADLDALRSRAAAVLDSATGV